MALAIVLLRWRSVLLLVAVLRRRIVLLLATVLPSILAAVSETSKPPTILSSAARLARNVAAETTIGPPNAVIEAILPAS